MDRNHLLASLSLAWSCVIHKELCQGPLTMAIVRMGSPERRVVCPGSRQRPVAWDLLRRP